MRAFPMVCSTLSYEYTFLLFFRLRFLQYQRKSAHRTYMFDNQKSKRAVMMTTMSFSPGYQFHSFSLLHPPDSYASLFHSLFLIFSLYSRLSLVFFVFFSSLHLCHFSCAFSRSLSVTHLFRSFISPRSVGSNIGKALGYICARISFDVLPCKDAYSLVCLLTSR